MWSRVNTCAAVLKNKKPSLGINNNLIQDLRPFCRYQKKGALKMKAIRSLKTALASKEQSTVILDLIPKIKTEISQSMRAKLS